ncbi:MAG: tRNA lysidine(34) synthetase TilS, partial [Bacteroidota bacterium]
LFNFSKGTGLKGLIGIPAINGRILRPLLGFSREELEIYYQGQKLVHREDASNAKDDYDRNKIRHQVVPVLKTINPGLFSNVATNLEHLKDTYLLFQERIQQLSGQMVTRTADQTKIKLPALMEHPAKSTLLYELLSPFNFHPNQIPQIIDCINRQKIGAIFYSKYYRLLVDRDKLIIQITKNINVISYEIKAPNQTLELPEGNLIIQEAEVPEQFPHDQSIAFINLEKLQFPMKLRRWQNGDQFCPLGMQGKHKKVQDLLSDLKIDRFTKDQIWILENGNNEICWVVGLRLDDRYKVQSPGTKCLQFIFQKEKNPLVHPIST